MRINSIDDLPPKYQSQARAKMFGPPNKIVGQENGEAVLAETVAESAEAAVTGSKLERDFLSLLRSAGLPEPEREAAYIPHRRFRADFLWKKAGLICEAEGGVWGRKSGHNSGTGIESDCLRSRLASLHGYRVYRITRKSLDETPMEIIAQITENLAPWY